MPSLSLCISAAMTGSGKTIFTSALINTLLKKGYSISAGKVGPDYIDPTYSRSLTKRDVFNFDTWAMNENTLDNLMVESSNAADFQIFEGVMGLFDGTSNQQSSTASFVKKYKIPVLLVIDATSQSQTLAAICKGLMSYDPEVDFIGVVLNKVASERHFLLIDEELKKNNINVIGYLPTTPDLVFPRRHLGLHLAHQINEYKSLIDKASAVVMSNIKIDQILSLAKPLKDIRPKKDLPSPINLGQKISIARDEAFSFIYDHTLYQWQKEGRELKFFSPLNDESPDKSSTGIYLPGGYPELHCETISKNKKFLESMKKAQIENKIIYGKCGGYMVLGESIFNNKNKEYKMLGFLDLITSFHERKLNLGYRKVSANHKCKYFDRKLFLTGHEYHYSTIIKEKGEPLFLEKEKTLSTNGYGLIKKNVFGSFLHLIDQKLK